MSQETGKKTYYVVVDGDGPFLSDCHEGGVVVFRGQDLEKAVSHLDLARHKWDGEPRDAMLKVAIMRALPDELDMAWTGFDCRRRAVIWRYSSSFVSAYEWNYLVGKVYKQFLEGDLDDFQDYRFFSPLATWQEIAEYLVEIGALTLDEAADKKEETK